MRYLFVFAVLTALLLPAPSVASPHRKKKGKKPTSAAMQRHLNRSLQEKGLIRFKDSALKK